MPTYEYACAACGHQWEQVQRIVEAPVEVCPKCAQSSAHRLISGGTNFILKGGGWYSDLYSSAKPASKSPEGSGSGPSKAEGSTSAESKGSSDAKTTETKAAPAASTGTTPSSPAPSNSSPAPSSST